VHAFSLYSSRSLRGDNKDKAGAREIKRTNRIHVVIIIMKMLRLIDIIHSEMN
jgi:hypothetical protein